MQNRFSFVLFDIAACYNPLIMVKKGSMGFKQNKTKSRKQNPLISFKKIFKKVLCSLLNENKQFSKLYREGWPPSLE